MMTSVTDKNRCPRCHLKWTDSSDTFSDPDTGKDFRNLRWIFTACLSGLIGTVMILIPAKKWVSIVSIREKISVAAGVLMVISSVITLLSTSIIEYGMSRRQSYWCEGCKLRWDIESYPERFPN